MAFNEANVRRDTDGQFTNKTGSAATVSLGGADSANIPERTRELFLEKELDYYIRGFGDAEMRNEFHQVYRDARTAEGTREGYEGIAEHFEKKSQAFFGSASGKRDAAEVADRARKCAAIVAAHEGAQERGNVRVATAVDAHELTDAEAREVYASLRRALEERDPDGAIHGPLRFTTTDERHFLMTYPDGSDKWMRTSDADALYKRLHAAYKGS